MQRTLAIIGGGQLGMFLCRAARELGITTLVVVPDGDAPATEYADTTLLTPLDRDGLAEQIALLADYVTFEFENVPDRLLEQLARCEEEGRLAIRPGAGVMQLLKNKSTQKAWLQEHDIPTLPYRLSQHPLAEKALLVETVGLPFVQKAGQGGYDGYGVQVIRTEADLDSLWDVPSVIEACLEEPVEIGVVVARSASGESIAFHPVRMAFDSQKNILDHVQSPAGLGQAEDAMATWLAQDVVRELDGVGVFAVEMFLLPDHGLVVNEVSPRVHNSGHHTVEAGGVSQFQQHVRAVCDLPLADPGAEPPAAIMRNLLYNEELEFLLDYPAGPVESRYDGVYLHWYGKREARTGRKMGHITCLCSDADEARRRINGFIDLLREPAEGAAA